MNTEERKHKFMEPVPDNLSDYCHKEGLPSYREGQILEWIWKKKVLDPLSMSNLPTSVREDLREKIYLPEIEKMNKSGDKTVKYKVKFWDKNEAETVLIKEGGRTTVCVSTGIGCPYGCLFCATGGMGFVRQLTPYEIAVQVLLAAFAGKADPTNVVLMGMGEPFYDYKGAIAACDMINDKRMLGIGQRKITVSTAGVVPGILFLAKSAKQYKLAVSLNASNDTDRKKIMPVARKWTMSALMDAVKQYTDITNKKVTFEYVLMKGFNDGPSDARKLSELLDGVLCKVNLIPYNRAAKGFERPEPAILLRFQEALKKEGIEVTTRFSKGEEIQAACGQLFTGKQKKMR